MPAFPESHERHSPIVTRVDVPGSRYESRYFNLRRYLLVEGFGAPHVGGAVHTPGSVKDHEVPEDVDVPADVEVFVPEPARDERGEDEAEEGCENEVVPGRILPCFLISVELKSM